MQPSIVRAVTALATRQHGAVGVRQLRDLGVDARVRRGAIAEGWLRPAAGGVGVLVVAGSPDTWWRQMAVGVLTVGEHGWASHEAAARLHGLDRSIEMVEFTVPRAQRRRDHGGLTVHTTDHVGRLDVVTVSNLRCTSATRTVIDLAYQGIPKVRLEAAIDSAVRLGLSAPMAIVARLGELRGPGRRGARQLDRLLVDAGGETRLERLFLQLVRRGGLPRPVTQRIVRQDGRHIARVDFLFGAAQVVVEVTGRVGHSSPSDRARDAHRRGELTDLGFRVYEYTWHQVRHQPDHVLTTLRARLAYVA